MRPSSASFEAQSDNVGVLIPGAAGSAAIGAIKSLRRHGMPLRIVSFDGEPLSAGFALSDAHYVVPTITQPSAYERVVDILRRENIRIILPTSATATSVFSQQKVALAEQGIVFAGCDSSVVALCDDKLRFWRFARELFPAPDMTELIDGDPARFPCFIKPRFGSGSKGSAICFNRADWAYLTASGEDFLVQEYLPGPEYSVDVLCDLEGDPLFAVPRERLSITDGVTIRANVVKDAGLQQLCLRLARALSIKGACCMQLKSDERGQLKFLEVNARLGGSTIITTLAGLNIPAFLVLMALHQDFTIPEFSEMSVSRFFDEAVLPTAIARS